MYIATIDYYDHENDDIETVDKKVDDVLRAWGYPGREPLAMCEHIERL